MLNNVQDLPKELEAKLRQLLATGEYVPVSREGAPEAETKRSPARILMTAERNLPNSLDFKKAGTSILKVPPLRVAKTDIAAHVKYLISLYCRSSGLPQPQVAPEALRRLQGYDFPGNLSELAGLVETGDHPVERRACTD